MTHVGFLLTGSPFDSERWRTAYELGRAALESGHEVSHFHYLDGAFVITVNSKSAERTSHYRISRPSMSMDLFSNPRDRNDPT